jgi:hypothetical protein
MANEQSNLNDPLGFMRNMWGQMGFNLPGMVTPTFDVEELDKRIKDMKAVEGWLRMNLSMLQMTIQGLEMQRSTVSAVKTMGQMASDAAQAMTPDSREPDATPMAAMASFPPGASNPSLDPANAGTAAMWPWQMMEQMREQMQQHAEASAQSKVTAAGSEKQPKSQTKK